MTDADRIRQFARKLESIRRRQGKLRPVRIAELAEQAGLSKTNILAQISRAPYLPRVRSRDRNDTISRFIGSMCMYRRGSIRKILEYTGTMQLFSAHLINSNIATRISIIASDAEFFESLAYVFRDRDCVTIADSENLLAKTQADIAIVHSPLGLKRSSDEYSDGFGGEAVRKVLPYIHENGTIYWLTGPFSALVSKAKDTLGHLEQANYHLHAVVDLAPGLMLGTNISGTLLLLRQKKPLRKFVGVLQDAESGNRMARVFNEGWTNKPGACWEWLDLQDSRTYGEVAHERALKAMAPRGPCRMVFLGDLLQDPQPQTIDETIEDATAQPNLFVPKLPNRLVTSRMEDQDVSARLVYRMIVDSTKANPQFLVQLLNSTYGIHLRQGCAKGMTIKNLKWSDLLALALPLPDLSMQDHIAELYSDIGLLDAELQGLQSTIQHDWSTVDGVVKKVDALKGVLDIDRQIKRWSNQLPYPLATIYRKYRVQSLPTDRFDSLLHFFEIAAVYLAVMGLSYTRAISVDYRTSIRNWLHPRKHTLGIKRPDFGFWIAVSRASFKELRRISSDPRRRNEALQLAGPEILETASNVGRLTKAIDALATPKEYRNRWKGHGGHIRNDDAKRLVGELQPSIRAFYESSASLLRGLKLIRLTKANFNDSGTTFDIEDLTGSDPRFTQRQVSLDEYPKDNRLAFWLNDSRRTCPVLPFFQFGAPTHPEETCVYVFNRIEQNRIRWISYQEARKPEYRTRDHQWSQSISPYLESDEG